MIIYYMLYIFYLLNYGFLQPKKKITQIKL